MQLQAGVFSIKPAELPRVVVVWEASVRATHHFVSAADIHIFKPMVRDALPLMAQLACIRDDTDQVAGFVAAAAGKIEMLFLHPAARGQGGGRIAPLLGPTRIRRLGTHSPASVTPAVTTRRTTSSSSRGRSAAGRP